MLLSGDENQLPALFDQFCGSEIEPGSWHNSRLLWEMAQGNHLKLTVCHRSDVFLFDFYSSLIRPGFRYSLGMETIVAHCLETFPPKGEKHLHNICISHRRRIRLNSDLNKHYKQNATWINVVPDNYTHNAGQSFWLHVGLSMIACVQNSTKLKNNLRYTVQGYDDENIQLLAQTGDNITVSMDVAKKHLRLGYCTTLASCQVREFNELSIFDLKSPKMTRTMLYVALSRCTDSKHLACFA